MDIRAQLRKSWNYGDIAARPDLPHWPETRLQAQIVRVRGILIVSTG